jgi:hypothetical protein
MEGSSSQTVIAVLSPKPDQTTAFDAGGSFLASRLLRMGVI